MAMVKAENLKLLDVDGSVYAVFDDGTMLQKLQDWKVLDEKLGETGEEPEGWEYVNDYLATQGLLVMEPEKVLLDNIEISAEQRAAAGLPAVS